MKKLLSSFIIPLAVFSLAVFAIPASAGAQTTGSPVITSISPTSGPSGTEISINGSGYTASSTALFLNASTGGGYELPVTFVNSNKIIFTVPIGSDAGSYMLFAVTNRFTSGASTFVVTAPSITVLSPNGGESYSISSETQIKWSATNFPNTSKVYIELRPNNFNVGSVQKIAVVSPVDGSYSWKIPVGIVSGQYIIEVYKADQNGNIDPNESTKDVSDAPFNIIASSTIPCYTFTRDLQYGDSDFRSGRKDVENLQNFLISKGFTIGDLTTLSASDKGYFGRSTFAALKRYQTSVKLPDTGYFGALTRAMVNAECASLKPTILSVSPEKGTPGTEIKVATANFKKGLNYYVAFLDPTTDSGANAILGDDGVLSFKVPTLKPGVYKISAGAYGVSGSDTGYTKSFTVLDGGQYSATITSGSETSSLTPTISGTATGLTNVGVVLSNSGGKVYGSGLLPVIDGHWSVVVSPALVAGQYNVSVYDSKSVKLTTGSLTVLPAPTTFSGNINVITRLNGVVLNSTQASGCVSTVKNATSGANNTAGCVRSLSNQPAGTYTVQWEGGYPAGADTSKKPVVSTVRFLGERPAGENPVTFYIDFAVKQAASVTVLYPNGGEQIMYGGKDIDFRTTWSSQNISGNVDIYLNLEDGRTCIIGTAPASQGVFTKLIGANYQCSNIPTKIMTGKYKILITSSADQTIKDKSDDFFMVTNASDPVTPSPTISYTANIITRLGGRVLTSSEANGCVANIKKNGVNSAGGCVYTLTNLPPGNSYQVEWLGGYPAGADTAKKPTVSPTYPQTLGERPAGVNPATFYIDFTAKPVPVTPPPATTTNISASLWDAVKSYFGF